MADPGHGPIKPNDRKEKWDKFSDYLLRVRLAMLKRDLIDKRLSEETRKRIPALIREMEQELERRNGLTDATQPRGFG